MKTRLIDGVEVHQGSGNIYADLGLPDADALQAKSSLLIEITRVMQDLGLSRQEAASRVGITQLEFAGMMRGPSPELSEQKLMECLARLSSNPL